MLTTAWAMRPFTGGDGGRSDELDASYKKMIRSDYRLEPRVFSKACEYALQTVIYLASVPDDQPILLRDIAAALHIPAPFLGKVLHLLTTRGLLSSKKGRQGGFSLGKPARQITPYEVVSAVDGPRVFDDCLLGFPGCDDDNACPLHAGWKEIKTDLLTILKDSDIEQLGGDVDAKLAFLQKHRGSRITKY